MNDWTLSKEFKANFLKDSNFTHELSEIFK